MRATLFIFTLMGILSSRALLALQIQANAILSNTTPYIHQSVVYVVRIISQNRILEFTPSPPTVSGAALELLNNQPRYNKRGNYFIYEYNYALTPLILDQITVPAMQISGSAEDQNNRQGNTQAVNFQVRTKSLILQARAIPLHAIQPWLPLQALELISAGELNNAQRGEPFTLKLWLRAIGTRGVRLPALIDLLSGPDFRIYAEQPVEYWEDIHPSDNAIRGQRHEILTVVPLRSGKLRLPMIKIPWWNTEKDQPTNLEWQLPEITVSEAPSPEGNSSNWKIPFGAVLIFLIGWAIGIAQFKNLLRFSEISNRISSLGKIPNFRPLSTLFISWLMPISSYYHTRRIMIQQLFSRALPGRFQTNRLIHQINLAANPEEIATALRIYANIVLDVPLSSPLMIIGEQLIKTQPKLFNSSLMQLLNQLDTAIYGINEEIPFELTQWKQQFQNIALSLRITRHQSADQHNLPPLNPN